MGEREHSRSGNAAGWTTEQRERIRAFVAADETDPSHLAARPVRETVETAPPVGTDDCRRWRTRLRDDAEVTGYDIAHEVGRAVETVRRHAYGRCQHPEQAVGEPADGHARKGGRGL